jgi:penicillin-binding protein 2
MGPIASLMIEKSEKKITRTDLETRVLNISLKDRYAILGGMKEGAAIETPLKDSTVKESANNRGSNRLH